MNFKIWLENNKKRQVLFTFWGRDGEIRVNIDGKQYKYYIDPVHLPRLMDLRKYKPWTVLNQIKKLNQPL